jgi:hypothetical protein
MHPLSQLSLALAVATLAACGGGSSSTVAPAAGSNNNTSNALEISGVAATGAALANANISIKCATGTGSATSAADGKYLATITGGALPCVVRATSADAQTVLHSALEGTGAGKYNLNISPMTEMVVTETQGGAPAGLFDQFDASKINQAALDAAKARVRASLASIVDMAGVDPVKDALVAASGTTLGNGLDQKLDKLRDALAVAQLKLSDLTALLVANAGGSISEIVKVTLQAPNPSCKGFRSGTYRIVEPANASKVYEITFDALTLSAVTPQGAVKMTATGCTLTAPDGTRVQMSDSGLGVMRTAKNTLGIVMPKQMLQVSDLAGQWSWVNRFPDSSAAIAGSAKVGWGVASYDSAGKALSGTDCLIRASGSPCLATAATSLTQLSSRADGGFDVAATGLSSERAYGFRSPVGVVGIVRINDSTGALTISRKGPIPALPTVFSTYKRFDIGVNSLNVVDSVYSVYDFKVETVSPATNSYTRSRASDCRVDKITLDDPFAGFFDRAAGAYVNCAGATLSLVEVVGLVGSGLGVSAYVIPSSNYFGASISTE